MIISFMIDGEPQGKARARTVKNKHTGRTHSYTPDDTMLYENLIKIEYRRKCDTYFGDKQPIRMTVTAYFGIPKSFSKRNKALAAQNRLRPTKKPDSDNIAKVICDALNGIAYNDDTQIVELTVSKLYTENSPRVIVDLEKVEEIKNNG